MQHLLTDDKQYSYILTHEFPFVPRCWRGEDEFLKAPLREKFTPSSLKLLQLSVNQTHLHTFLRTLCCPTPNWSIISEGHCALSIGL